MRSCLACSAFHRAVCRFTSSTGRLYQGRFKSFPIQTTNYFCAVVRYGERNPLRANLVSPAILAIAFNRASAWLPRRAPSA